MKILNLGCGTKTCSNPDVINIDWSIELRLRRNRLLRRVVPRLLGGERRDRFIALPDNILVHNLAKKLPFESDSIDAVYHSHLLEHLDPDVAELFLREVLRILKPGRIQRIVVPDLEKAGAAYLAHIAQSENDDGEAARHDTYVAAMIEQCVRREAHGIQSTGKFIRAVENAILGDARRRGETHQWMYDRINLGHLLSHLGYRQPVVQACDTSLIADWNRYGLDSNGKGQEYKPTSLYMEARK